VIQLDKKNHLPPHLPKYQGLEISGLEIFVWSSSIIGRMSAIRKLAV
jgi:hypothetical protein